jgi:DNA-binding SARP family transcriptional activator
MEPLWRIEMLGGLRVVPAEERAGGRILTRFRSRRGAALLAYLAYHPRHPHPREGLIELLWPEAPVTAGRGSLRTELCWLRRALEPPGVPAGSVLLTDGDAVGLNPAACLTDVAAFEGALRSAAGRGAERARWLAAAVERYRGELLPGICEAWVVPERLRLLDGFLDAVDELARDREAAGDRAGALQWAWRAAGIDPLGEMAGAERGGVCRPCPVSLADREQSLRQQLCARTAEVEALRRQLAAQTEAAETLRRRLQGEGTAPSPEAAPPGNEVARPSVTGSDGP